MRVSLHLGRIAATLTAGLAPPVSLAAPPVDRIELPTGFSVEVVAENATSARQLALGPRGTLFIGSLRAGNVYAYVDADNDGRYETRHVIARRLELPSGIAMRGNDLYVGAVNSIWRFPDIESRLDDPQRVLVTDALPDARHHGWKYLGFGPDGHLYVPVGAPCNVCLHEDDEPRFASLLRMNPDTGEATVLARGIRNSVGFAWHPVTRRLWFSDNGRDMLGDDVPPDEINVITAPGQHFGFPFVHATDIPDPEFGARGAGRQFEPPRLRIQAHSATLGIEFYQRNKDAEDAFPERYDGALFIAEHGSWNRSSKVGYQVSVAYVDAAGNITAHEPFMTGLLRGQRAWGRPNDVMQAPDGSLLVSDDQADAVYRVRWTGATTPSGQTASGVD